MTGEEQKEHMKGSKDAVRKENTALGGAGNATSKKKGQADPAESPSRGAQSRVTQARRGSVEKRSGNGVCGREFRLSPNRNRSNSSQESLAGSQGALHGLENSRRKLKMF